MLDMYTDIDSVMCEQWNDVKLLMDFIGSGKCGAI